MTEKDYNNEFRFSLHQEDVLLCEIMFSADQFNPFTRYSIDIRDILPRAISKLQKTLSKKSYQTSMEVGRIDLFADDCDSGDNQHKYELFDYHQKMIDLYPREWRNDMQYNPKMIVQQVIDSLTLEEKTIKGIECKIGFYINDKTIVERVFYVDGFNPMARWSCDIVDTMNDIADVIFGEIKINDIKNMWDDYDLINIMGLSIGQIRELPLFKRNELLRRISKN